MGRRFSFIFRGQAWVHLPDEQNILGKALSELEQPGTDIDFRFLLWDRALPVEEAAANTVLSECHRMWAYIGNRVRQEAAISKVIRGRL